MIVIGYLVTIAYVFFMILVVGNLINKLFNAEMSRKAIHTGLFFVWVLLWFFFKDTIHQVIIPIIFIIVNYLSYKFKIFKTMEREGEKELGTVYFSIAITIIMLIALIYPSTYYCSGIATFCLTFGDGFAAIIGENTKSKKIRCNKTINGFLSCFIFSFFATYLFNYFYNLDLNILMCLSIGYIAAIFELVGSKIDNFTVVFSTFVLSIILLNYNIPLFLESILLAEVLFSIVFFAKGLSYYGSLLAMAMCVIYTCFEGIFGITLLLSEYFFIFFVAVFKKIYLKEKHKEKTRNFWQVLINGGLGTLFMILYGIFKNKDLLIISVISLSGCLIDSVSSDVGVLSKCDSYDFIKRKRVRKGISGGVSLLGTTASLVCSFIIAFATYKCLKLSFIYIFLITGLIFFQTFIDTVFGSLLQAKYKCVKCNRVTEKLEHCGKKTKLIGGISWINNNVVNIMSSVVTTLIAFIIIWWCK